MSQATAASPSTPWGQIAAITGAAIAIYFGIRLLPTGTNLSHSDFAVAEGGVEFCDPANPQFIPVVQVKSPVSLAISSLAPARQGETVQAEAILRTSAGKPIGPNDLFTTHTEKLHLLLLDPGLRDYQHVHPVPGKSPGTWRFAFTPRSAGTYRVFADFTPAATARGLYASADLNVSATQAASAAEREDLVATASNSQLTYELLPAKRPIKANEVSEFRFTVKTSDGKAVVLEPVMDALAHLVAVDEARTGFAHLHPTATQSSGLQPGEGPLVFKITIPKPGRYVIWSQIKVQGQERYAPFWFDVET
jgi:hypothetical protein